MSPQNQSQDLDQILAKYESGWRELVEILLANRKESVLPSPPSSQTADAREDTDAPACREPVKPAEAQASPRELHAMGRVNAAETEAIFQRVERMQRDGEVMERLAKVEKQNRKIMILGSMMFTLFALAMFAFAFLVIQTKLWQKTGVVQAPQEVAVAKSDKNAGVLPASNHQTDAAGPAEAAPDFKYMGSKTSNKYHYPDCKWAKTIAEEKLIRFKSVEEAEEQGYKPCPTCKPPLED